jgi:hypothetical protein
VATTSTLPPRALTRFDAPAPLRLWHLTSLDAPTVAVTWTLAFAWCARINLPLWVPALIGLSSWTVYIADRLLDARSATSPLRPRHVFHWKHRGIFTLLAVIAAVISAALIVHSMPVAARTRNSILAAAALLYFTGVHSPWRLPRPAFPVRLRMPKELLVGILFTLACAAPTWARMPAQRFVLAAPVCCFIALAWLNCHAIESWEAEQPSQRRAFSIFHLATSLAGIAAFTASVALLSHHPRIAPLLATASVSSALLACLDCNQHHLTSTGLRAAADLVLLTPVLLPVLSFLTQ